VRTDPKGSGEGQGRAMGLSKPRLTSVIRKVPEPDYAQPHTLGLCFLFLAISHRGHLVGNAHISSRLQRICHRLHS
jgi:hypothetical protein